MALVQKLELGTSAVLAAMITASIWVISTLLNISGLSVSIQPLFAISGVTPFTATPSAKVISFLTGIIPGGFDVMSLVTIFLSAWVIVWAGFMILRFFPAIAKINPLGSRFASVAPVFWTIIAGTAVFYVIIVGFVMNSWEIGVGLAVYTLVVSYVTTLLAGLLGVKI